MQKEEFDAAGLGQTYIAKIGDQWVGLRVELSTFLFSPDDSPAIEVEAAVMDSRERLERWLNGVKEERNAVAYNTTGRIGIKGLLWIKDMLLRIAAGLKQGELIGIRGTDDRRTQAYRAMTRYGWTFDGVCAFFIQCNRECGACENCGCRYHPQCQP
jgi:hypothetical protein